jgi:hypothetical protein
MPHTTSRALDSSAHSLDPGMFKLNAIRKARHMNLSLNQERIHELGLNLIIRRNFDEQDPRMKVR